MSVRWDNEHPDCTCSAGGMGRAANCPLHGPGIGVPTLPGAHYGEPE